MRFEIAPASDPVRPPSGAIPCSWSEIAVSSLLAKGHLASRIRSGREVRQAAWSDVDVPERNSCRAGLRGGLSRPTPAIVAQNETLRSDFLPRRYQVSTKPRSGLGGEDIEAAASVAATSFRVSAGSITS